MQLSTHFCLAELTVSQVAERRGMDNTPGPGVLERLRRTAAGLEAVRAALDGAPMIVSSGYRSPAVNRLVGGATKSQHLFGEAVDFIAPRFGGPFEVCRAIAESGVPFDQLIHEFGGWVHVSFVRGEPRGQVLTVDRLGTRTGLHRARG